MQRQRRPPAAGDAAAAAMEHGGLHVIPGELEEGHLARSGLGEASPPTASHQAASSARGTSPAPSSTWLSWWLRHARRRPRTILCMLAAAAVLAGLYALYFLSLGTSMRWPPPTMEYYETMMEC